ncbi:MAG: NAD(P)/FAD-dependent oxidoreductase [Saprospiraceae bacterium]|nr:NAD(P)/FAD-dependent oxidoreductase [Saprospiraceae bacterium]
MHIVIIGNGISGVTAARFIRQLSDYKITLISSETDYFFSRTALMYIYMGHMRYEDTKPYEDNFWIKNRIDLLRAYVEQIDTRNKTLYLKDKQTTLHYDKLIIATGSSPNKFGWPGQDLEAVQGMYSYQDLEGMERYSKGLKRAVIVGGGLIGIEMAEMFHSRNIPVTFLVREKSYWNNVLPPEESEMINRHIKENHIDLRLGTELKEILPDKNGRAAAVITNTGEKIECQFVGLTAGVHPNIGFIKTDEANGIECARGILVDNHLQTSIENVYAIGDCAQLRTPHTGRRPIEAIWYTGRMMGEVAAYNVCDKPVEYKPRLWFNSAKFFEIEYQVYGYVSATLPEHHEQIYWEAADGRKGIRVIWEKESGHIQGFNLMGIRYRQEVCEKWIQDKVHVETVLEQLGMANFDPEFFKQYEAKLVAAYNQKTGKQLQLKQKRNLGAALRYLKGKMRL